MKRILTFSFTIAVVIGLILLNSPSADAGLAVSVDKSKKPKVELVFVLDTTGSMKSLIAAAKDKIWSITNTIVSAKPTPDIKIGLVGFRDKRDKYITKISKMTYDLDAV